MSRSNEHDQLLGENEYRQRQKKAFEDARRGFHGNIPPEIRQAFGIPKKIIQQEPLPPEKDILGPFSPNEKILIRAARIFILPSPFENSLAQVARNNSPIDFPIVSKVLAEIALQLKNEYFTTRFGIAHKPCIISKN